MVEKLLTSISPALVKIKISNAKYWSVSLRVSCGREGISVEDCMSVLCLDLRYTEIFPVNYVDECEKNAAYL